MDITPEDDTNMYYPEVDIAEHTICEMESMADKADNREFNGSNVNE